MMRFHDLRRRHLIWNGQALHLGSKGGRVLATLEPETDYLGFAYQTAV
jgi:hypothetical protein